MPLFEFISKHILCGSPRGEHVNGSQRPCSPSTDGCGYRTVLTYRHRFYTLPLVFYAGLIFFLSSLSRVPSVLPPVLMYDKLLHFLEYAPFGYLIMRMLVTSSQPVLARGAVVGTIFFGAVFGMSDEFHQSFVPERDASVLDVLADAAGVAAAAFAYGIIRFKLPLVRTVEDGIEKGLSHGE